MKRFILLLGFFMVIGTSMAQTTCENTTIIYGKVYLDNNTNPIENATVIAFAKSGYSTYYLGIDTTNSTGDYSISLNLSYLPSDRVYLEVYKSGALKNKTAEFHVSCGVTIPKNITYTTCLGVPTGVGGSVKYNGTFISESINITAYVDGLLIHNSTLSDPTQQYIITLIPIIITGLSSNLTVVAESKSFKGSRSEIWGESGTQDSLCSTFTPPNTNYDISINYKCDLNHDGIIINDWNELMAAYKCFLEINKNCESINYQDWTNMKEEYKCFVNNQ